MALTKTPRRIKTEYTSCVLSIYFLLIRAGEEHNPENDQSCADDFAERNCFPEEYGAPDKTPNQTDRLVGKGGCQGKPLDDLLPSDGINVKQENDATIIKAKPKTKEWLPGGQFAEDSREGIYRKQQLKQEDDLKVGFAHGE
jgi:hypothetical protein